MLQLAAYFNDFVDKPSKLSVLYCVQVNWLMQLGVVKVAGLPCYVVAESAVLLATLEAIRRETWVSITIRRVYMYLFYSLRCNNAE